MACLMIRRLPPVLPGAIGSGFAVCMVAVLVGFAGSPAVAQALRSPSANSVAAGATADRNSTSTPSTPGLPAVNARQSTSTGTGSQSRYSILGVPLRVAAPVTSPYNDNSLGTFAGQPERGRDTVIQQSIDGAP